MKRETVTAKGAGEVLAGPAMSAREATGRFRRWQMVGIIPTVGQEADGRAAFLFDQAAPAIASVLFWAHDHAGIIDRPTLATFWRYLADPHHLHGVPAIDHVLAEVMAGGEPVLVLTRWGNVNTGEVLTTAALRFDNEYERPIAAPAKSFEVLADTVLELAPLLERFVGNNVMPFAHVAEAAH